MWHAEKNYGHSAHLFAIQTQSCPIARRNKLWSFCAFCHPVAASPMTCGNKLWSFRTPFSPFRHNRARWHAETNYGHSAPFIIQRRRARWHAETNYGHSAHLFAIQRRSCPMARRDKLWSFCAFPSRLDRVRWHAKTNYGHSVPFCHPETIMLDDMQRQIMVIRTLLLSVRLDAW